MTVQEDFGRIRYLLEERIVLGNYYLLPELRHLNQKAMLLPLEWVNRIEDPAIYTTNSSYFGACFIAKELCDMGLVDAVILGGSVLELLRFMKEVRKAPSRTPEDIDLGMIYVLKPQETADSRVAEIHRALSELTNENRVSVHPRIFEFEELRRGVNMYTNSPVHRHQLLSQIQGEGAEKHPIIYALSWILGSEDLQPIPHFGDFRILYGKEVIESLRP